MITTGFENESVGTVALEALYYGDFSDSGTPTTNHDLAKHDSAAGYTYIVGKSYNNHVEEPGEEDEAECIDTGNLVTDVTNCANLVVELADVTMDPAYAQSITEVNGTSLEFSSDFAEAIPSDLESVTCVDGTSSGSEDDGPSEETISACADGAGITSPEETLGDIGEATFVEFCLCIGEGDFDETGCADVYNSCDATESLQVCMDSQGS
jgi:hypothetical protein